MKIATLISVISISTSVACNSSSDKNYKKAPVDTTQVDIVSDNEKVISATDGIPSFDTTTIQGKAKKLLWELKDSDEYSYAIYNGTDTLIDLNGDKQLDLLIEFYGGSGTGLKNGVEMVLFDKSTKQFLINNPINLSNPTFDFKNKTVVSYYVALGGGSAHTLKWNGFKLDTLEFIDVDITHKKDGTIKVKSVIHNYVTGKTKQTVSNSVSLPGEYKYFDYKPIVRKE